MLAAQKAVQDSRYNKLSSFSSAHRLLRNTGFSHVLHSGAIADKFCKIYFVRNKETNARLGMIVGKRTLSNAVDRNRVKRAIREAFRHHHIILHNIDLVVMVRRPFDQASVKQAEYLNVLFSMVENRCAEL